MKIPSPATAQKQLRRIYVEKHLERARQQPAQIVDEMVALGMLSHNTTRSQAEHHLQDLIRKIDSQGLAFPDPGRRDKKELFFKHYAAKEQHRAPRVKKPSVSLFGADAFKPKKADKPWTPLDTDLVLDYYFGAQSHVPELWIKIGFEMDRKPKAIERHVQLFLYNEHGREAINYAPECRLWRGGKKFTGNERLVISRHAYIRLPIEVTARLLQRTPQEITHELRQMEEERNQQDVGNVLHRDSD